jgi:transposase
VNGEGRPVRLRLTAGQRHDMDQAESLVEGLAPDDVVADKAYDSDPLRATIRRHGGKPVIPSRKGRRRRRHDRTRYKLRNRVKRFFNRLKHCRRVDTRYDKVDANYEEFLCLA